jgi:hypothetical protein
VRGVLSGRESPRDFEASSLIEDYCQGLFRLPHGLYDQIGVDIGVMEACDRLQGQERCDRRSGRLRPMSVVHPGGYLFMLNLVPMFLPIKDLRSRGKV